MLGAGKPALGTESGGWLQIQPGYSLELKNPGKPFDRYPKTSLTMSLTRGPYMLYFVIPLRSAKTTANWVAVQRLLERTLRSVDNQICQSFRSLVVCHERPDDIEIPDSWSLKSTGRP